MIGERVGSLAGAESFTVPSVFVGCLHPIRGVSALVPAWAGLGYRTIVCHHSSAAVSPGGCGWCFAPARSQHSCRAGTIGGHFTVATSPCRVGFEPSGWVHRNCSDARRRVSVLLPRGSPAARFSCRAPDRPAHSTSWRPSRRRFHCNYPNVAIPPSGPLHGPGARLTGSWGSRPD